MGKDKGGDYDPDYWADWTDGWACGHRTEDYVSETVKSVEVPMCSEGKRKWANTGRVFLGILTLGITELVAGCPGGQLRDFILSG
jgi:hypothetical protein